MADKRHIHLVDTTMRDGSHALRHSYTVEQVTAIAKGLDAAGVEMIELSHGDGVTGSTYNYGFSAVDETQLMQAAAGVINRARQAVLLVPGIGTVEDMERVKGYGVNAVRIATHVTEADISEQHIGAAKKLDLFTCGFLMMIHMSEPKAIAEQAKMMESYGADYVNIADSSGYLLPDDVRRRVSAVFNAVNIPVGFHAHNNLGLAVANSLVAVEEGASYIDATLRGLGAGAGNTQLEVMDGVLKRAGYHTGLDFFALQDLAASAVDPILPRPQVIDNDSLMLGYAGVYSSFLLHVRNAAKKFDIEPRSILIELGKRGMVGGQEDMIIDVAYQLAKK